MPAATRRYETDPKAAAALAQALQDLPDEWVMCRDMRHAWEVEVDFHVLSVARRGAHVQEIGRTLNCLRCGTLRKEVYHATPTSGLEKVSQHYAYPENYQMKGVPRGVKPHNTIQAEQYRRAMSKIAGSHGGNIVPIAKSRA